MVRDDVDADGPAGAEHHGDGGREWGGGGAEVEHCEVLDREFVPRWLLPCFISFGLLVLLDERFFPDSR